MATTTATKLINLAKGEIQNSKYGRPNKYTRWFYGNNTAAPWCGIFVAYVIKYLCQDTDLLKGCQNPAYVPNIYNWAKEKGYVKMSPKKGDLIIFDWECGNGKFDKDHVGFFVKDNGNGTITTIEGNTSSISDGNGDCVQQRIRDKKWVGCYIRLPYKEEKVTSTVVATKSKYSGTLPKTTLSTSKGTKAEIKLWQKFLNWYYGCELKVDGIFGTMTFKQTKTFQREFNLVIDGIVGAKTISKAKMVEK